MTSFRQLKLARLDNAGVVLGSVDLVLPAEQRASRARMTPWAAAGSGAMAAAGGAAAAAPQVTADSVIDKVVKKDLGLLASELVEKLRVRLRPPAAHSYKLACMRKALDLRRMADTPTYEDAAFVVDPSAGGRHALGTLVHWFEQRDANEAQADDDIPTLAVAEAQFRELCKRLRAAAVLPAFRHWAGASGVVIMKDVYTMTRFSAGCEAYLHLWLNIALKTMNESVVEGMGGVWDRSSPDARHCSFPESVKEAVVAWNGPWPYHAEAVPFVNHTLNHLFGTSDWAGRFTHGDERTYRVPAWASSGGKVVGRRKEEDKGKLPSHFYDTPAPAPAPAPAPILALPLAAE